MADPTLFAGVTRRQASRASLTPAADEKRAPAFGRKQQSVAAARLGSCRGRSPTTPSGGLLTPRLADGDLRRVGYQRCAFQQCLAALAYAVLRQARGAGAPLRPEAPHEHVEPVLPG